MLPKGDYLNELTDVLVAISIAVGLHRWNAGLTPFRLALVQTVAAIPVAMPTLLFATRAIGGRPLVRKQVFVSKLVLLRI